MIRYIFIISALGCSSSQELDQPNPPPVWYIEEATVTGGLKPTTPEDKDERQQENDTVEKSEKVDIEQKTDPAKAPSKSTTDEAVTP